MAKKKKYYVVWQGAKPGIYETWNECKLQITAYPGAKYKSYPTLAEAEYAYYAGAEASLFKAKSAKKQGSDYRAFLNEIVKPSLSVDAACSGNPGIVEYQGVDTETKDVIFRMGPFDKGTNNLGEFLALIHGLAYLNKTGSFEMPIYSDSRTAMSWLRKQKVKTTFFDKHENPELRELLDRAILWMKTNEFKNPVLKWNTKKWGEIPADFGRK